MARPRGDRRLVGQALRSARHHRGLVALTWAAACVVIAFRVFPLAYSLIISFYDAFLLRSDAAFVGAANFRRVFADAALRSALVITVKYVAGVLALSTVLGLGIAAAIRRWGVWAHVMRIGFLLPSLMPTVVAAMLWTWLYDPYYGLFNQALAAVGVSGPAWLKDPRWAPTALVLMGTWREVGLVALIYLAFLARIPEEVEAAARVDGASDWLRWRYVILPLLWPATLLTLLISGLRLFDMFAPVFVMTGGGPAGATTTWTYYLYATAFERSEIGYASAMALVVGAGFAAVMGLARSFARAHGMMPS